MFGPTIDGCRVESSQQTLRIRFGSADPLLVKPYKQTADVSMSSLRVLVNASLYCVEARDINGTWICQDDASVAMEIDGDDNDDDADAARAAVTDRTVYKCYQEYTAITGQGMAPLGGEIRLCSLLAFLCISFYSYLVFYYVFFGLLGCFFPVAWLFFFLKKKYRSPVETKTQDNNMKKSLSSLHNEQRNNAHKSTTTHAQKTRLMCVHQTSKSRARTLGLRSAGESTSTLPPSPRTTAARTPTTTPRPGSR